MFAKQIKGITTGTSSAPSIANLFLGIVGKNEIIEQFKTSLPFLKDLLMVPAASGNTTQMQSHMSYNSKLSKPK